MTTSALALILLAAFVSLHFHPSPSVLVPAYSVFGPILAWIEIKQMNGLMSCSSMGLSEWYGNLRFEGGPGWTAAAAIVGLTHWATVPKATVDAAVHHRNRTHFLAWSDPLPLRMTPEGWRTLIGAVTIIVMAAFTVLLTAVALESGPIRAARKKSGGVSRTIKLFMEDRHLHFLMPMVFFSGAQQAFMARWFLEVRSQHCFGHFWRVASNA